MGFDEVYKALEQVFPHVDKRILRAVAIEHSDDLNTALDYIFTEALPYVSTKSVSSVTPQENQQPLGKTDERAVKVVFKPLKENGPPTTSMPTSRTREQQSMPLKHHVVVENNDVGSSSTSGLLLFQNGNHVDQSSVMLDHSEKSVFEEALNTPVLSDKDDDNMLDFSDTETSLIRSSQKRKDAKVNGGPIFTSSMVENTDVGSSSTSGLLLFQNGNHVDQSSVMLDHSEKSVFEDCFPKPSSLSSPSQLTSSISITDTVNGSHELKITGYSLLKGMEVGKYIASDTFMVGGYAWAIYFYPNGKRDEEYVSLFIALTSEGTDVRALFELTLLDQSGNERHKVHTHFDRELESGPFMLKHRGSMWGYKRFFKRTLLESSEYLKDDCLSIQCRVGVIRSKEPSDTETSLIGKDAKVNGGPSSMVSLASMQASDVGVCGSPSLEQEGQNGYESDQDTLACAQISYEETSLNSVPLEVVVTSDDHEADQDTLACAHNEDSSLDNTPLEIALSVVERALCSDEENLQDNDALDYSVTSFNDYGVVVTHCEKPEATYSLDLNVSQVNSVSDLLDDEEESLLNTSLTRSQEICSVDFLEEIIEDAKNNKKTLFNAMESVIDTMREVEQREKEAEEAKEEAARAGEDILSQSEDLKKMLQHAKDANDTHAGEVYGEKSILATEARELQSRLLCLSGERDKSLAILHELNISLQARLALADEEIASAEMEKLEKEQAAEERLTEQKIIMEKVVEESKILQQEAEENSKLREFLVDRGRVVDILQGEISVICQDVRLLKERFDERVPLSKSVSSSQTTCKLASSSSSLKSVASVHALEQFQFSESPKKAASVDGESQKSNPVHPPAYNSNSWDDGWDLLENDD